MMKKNTSNMQESDDISDLPPLPPTVWLKDGCEINISGKIWRFWAYSEGRVSCVINLHLLDKESPLTQRARHLVKLFLSDRLSKRKPMTVTAYFRSILRFTRWIDLYVKGIRTQLPGSHFDWSDFDEAIFRAYLDYGLQNTATNGDDFAMLRLFYQWGVARQYRDFDLALLHILKSIRAEKHPQGHHVRFRHQTKGGYSEAEQLAIQRAIDDDEGDKRDRAIVMLHLELGVNSNATIRLKNKDLKRYAHENKVMYQLKVPRGKKRATYRETKQRPISPKLGELLESLMEGGPEDPLIHWLPDGNPNESIHATMRRYVKAAHIVSPRTKKLLVMYPRRYRISLATQMLADGASPLQAAEGLDHEDLTSIRMYVETQPDIAEKVDKATHSGLAPVVNLFLGKIVTSEEIEATKDGPDPIIPAAIPHLPFPLLTAGGIGICGKDIRIDGLCQLFPPLSCYSCSLFCALRDGPHEEILRSIEQFISDTRDSIDLRIVKQLEGICDAIRGVIQQCASHKKRSIE